MTVRPMMPLMMVVSLDLTSEVLMPPFAPPIGVLDGNEIVLCLFREAAKKLGLAAILPLPFDGMPVRGMTGKARTDCVLEVERRVLMRASY